MRDRDTNCSSPQTEINQRVFIEMGEHFHRHIGADTKYYGPTMNLNSVGVKMGFKTANEMVESIIDRLLQQNKEPVISDN